MNTLTCWWLYENVKGSPMSLAFFLWASNMFEPHFMAIHPNNCCRYFSLDQCVGLTNRHYHKILAHATNRPSLPSMEPRRLKTGDLRYHLDKGEKQSTNWVCEIALKSPMVDWQRTSNCSKKCCSPQDQSITIQKGSTKTVIEYKWSCARAFFSKANFTMK